MQMQLESTNGALPHPTGDGGPSAAERITRFVEYAMAFEQVLTTDDWTLLEPFFTADAEREVVGGGPLAIHSVGRGAVIADLRRGVEEMDRRFDLRLPEIVSGPTERDGRVWIDWRLTLRRAGLPDLVVDGTHGTSFEGNAISRIDEALTNATTERVVAYFAEHDPHLLPAPDAAATATSDVPLTKARMRALVEGYAAAKSRGVGAGG